MYSIWPIFTVCAITMLCEKFVLGTTFQDCVRKDSISCLQIQLYHKVKSIISNKTISLIDGMVQIRMRNDSASLGQENYDKLLKKAVEVEDRQKLLETYLMGVVENIWKQRSITFNPFRIAKGIIEFIPNRLKENLANFLSQGRGKNKRLKKYVPLLVGLKVISAIVASVSFVVIALIANKAMLAAVISFIFIGYEGFSTIINPKQPIQPEIVPYDTGNDFLPQYGAYEVHDLSSAYSDPAPYQKMFIGHKGA